MIFPVILGNQSKMELCTKKRKLLQSACREIRASYDVVFLCEVNADGQEQTRLCTRTLLRSSNPLACTSRFSAVVAELLIS